MKKSPIYDRIDAALSKRYAAHQLRSIPAMRQRDTIDVSSNSYLSLHTNETVATTARILSGERFHGNLASRLVAEESPLFTELEKEIASWKRTESALLFNSGYAANVGIIQALCTRDTEVFCDRLNHASIYDGIALSGCRLNRYRHNDMDDLVSRLSVSRSKEKLIITDTVFSMDGDRAALSAICEIAERYGCMVMVDEAHATGIFGAHGSGLTEEDAVEDAIDIRMGTLSKAVAGLGGYVAGSEQFRNYFVNFCRSLIYSTALPHTVLAHNLAAIRYIRSNPGLGKMVLEKAEMFRKRLHHHSLSTLNSSTQIIPCIVHDAAAALSLATFLREQGITAPAIRPPTVPEGTARLRISIHAGLTEDQCEAIAGHIVRWKALYHDS